MAKSQQYANSEIFIDEDFERALYQILSPRYADLSPEELDVALEDVLGDLSLEELEDFLGGLNRAMNQAGQFLQKAAPGALSGAAQGAAAGAALGPYGALIGGLGGLIAGGAQSVAASNRPAATPTLPAGGTMMPSAPAGTAAPAARIGSSPAAAQLIGTLLRPETIQALMSMFLGPASNGQVMVGNTQVPVGAFANLIGTLANRAAAEYNAATPTQGPEIPEYLLNSAGEFTVDPSIPENRADALLQLLAREVVAEAWDELAADGDQYEEASLFEDLLHTSAIVGRDDGYILDLVFDD